MTHVGNHALSSHDYDEIGENVPFKEDMTT